MSIHLLAINGSLTQDPSRTRAALDVALDGARSHDPSITTSVLELREFDLQFCDGRPSDQYNGDTREALRRVASADAYLVATPVYRASLTGALKNFLDLIPNDPGGDDPLRGKVVGLLATGGSHHHYLVLEHQLRPLFGFFGAHTVARTVYGASQDFNELKRPQGRLVRELAALGTDVAVLALSLQDVAAELAPDHLGIRRG